MENINNLKPEKAIIFNDGKEDLILIENKTNALVFTDGTDFDEEYEGLITFLSEDSLEIDDAFLIPWEYIVEINIV